MKNPLKKTSAATIIVVLLLLGLVIGGGYYFRKKHMAKKKADDPTAENGKPSPDAPPVKGTTQVVQTLAGPAIVRGN